MKRIVFYLMIAILMMFSLAVYIVVVHNSTGYHLARIKGDGNSIDLYEWVMGYRDAGKIELHLSQMERLSGIRREIYTYDFKNVRPNQYSRDYMFKLIDGIDVVFARDIGSSILRDDKQYNYYVIVWANDKVHKEVQDRWLDIKK